MTDAQINEAIVQVKSFVKDKYELYRQDKNNFDFYYVREILRSLGYNTDDCNTVINEIAKRGFSYCLDTTISSNDENGKAIYPPEQVCWWGVDQLHSRLQCIGS